jgi:heterodisulfide reductase subunit C
MRFSIFMAGAVLDPKIMVGQKLWHCFACEKIACGTLCGRNLDLSVKNFTFEPK